MIRKKHAFQSLPFGALGWAKSSLWTAASNAVEAAE